MSDSRILYILNTLIIPLILYVYKQNRIKGVINFLVMLCYSFTMYYNMFFNSKGGISLLFWVLWIFFLLVHILGLIIWILLNHFKHRDWYLKIYSIIPKTIYSQFFSVLLWSQPTSVNIFNPHIRPLVLTLTRSEPSGRFEESK